MNTASALSLLACLLVLPIGCKQESSTAADYSGQGRGNADTPQSTPEQLALKEAQAFLDGGGDVNAKDSLGTTRLADAALNDYGAVVMLLASEGADVDAVDDTLGQTALHFCAIGDNARAAAALIQKGAKVNARDRRGKTPLHEAAAAGAVDLLKLLLSNKADVKARDGMGKTPIDRAVRAHQEQAVALLLTGGSDPAHESSTPTPVSSKSDVMVVKNEVSAPATPIPPPSQMVTKIPTESASPPAPTVTGIFPAHPFNGMQIEYRLEGVSIERSKDIEDFTTSRTLTGKVTGNSLRVAGRIGMGSGISAVAHVRLKSGPSNLNLPLTLDASDPSMNWRDFDLSVPVASEAAEFAIEMIGTYNITQRRLLLTGNFNPAGAIMADAQTTPNPTQSPEVAAAGDLAEMILWWGSQPWVNALKKSMPRGATISMHAEPYDAGGWSDVEMREHHAPDSGFDPNVSPMVGLFRVSRVGRKIEWMEPVSGEYEPLEGFLKQRGLKVADRAVLTPPSTRPVAGAPSITAGDFESKPPAIPNRDVPVIVKDPADAKNHVARITGPDEMGFTLPISVPSGTEELTIALRLLHPEGTKLIRFEDGRMPEGIRLRVRLLNDLGNSAIRDAVVRPTGQWREMEFTFYDLPKTLVQISVEAIWMEGPVYVDDVSVRQPAEGGAR